MSRVIHFDLSADYPERAAEFYRHVFNWTVNKWEGPEDYWLISRDTEKEPGVTGSIAGRITPEDTSAVVFDVESVDEMAADKFERQEKPFRVLVISSCVEIQKATHLGLCSSTKQPPKRFETVSIVDLA